MLLLPSLCCHHPAFLSPLCSPALPGLASPQAHAGPFTRPGCEVGLRRLTSWWVPETSSTSHQLACLVVSLLGRKPACSAPLHSRREQVDWHGLGDLPGQARLWSRKRSAVWPAAIAWVEPCGAGQGALGTLTKATGTARGGRKWPLLCLHVTQPTLLAAAARRVGWVMRRLCGRGYITVMPCFPCPPGYRAGWS